MANEWIHKFGVLWKFPLLSIFWMLISCFPKWIVNSVVIGSYVCFIPVLSRAPNILLSVCTNSLSYFHSCILHNATWKIMLTQTRSGTFLLIHLFYRLCYCTVTLYNLASFHLPRLNFIAFPNPLSFDVLSLPICSLNFKILYLSSSDEILFLSDLMQIGSFLWDFSFFQ